MAGSEAGVFDSGQTGSGCGQAGLNACRRKIDKSLGMSVFDKCEFGLLAARQEYE